MNHKILDSLSIPEQIAYVHGLRKGKVVHVLQLGMEALRLMEVIAFRMQVAAKAKDSEDEILRDELIDQGVMDSLFCDGKAEVHLVLEKRLEGMTVEDTIERITRILGLWGLVLKDLHPDKSEVRFTVALPELGTITNSSSPIAA